MARPLSSPEKKKTTIIKFRVTDTEKTQIEQLAWSEDLTVSDLLKSKVLGKEPKRRKASPERTILIKGMTELQIIGKNINQIAKVLNSGRAHELHAEDISNSLYALNQLFNRVVNALESGN